MSSDFRGMYFITKLDLSHRCSTFGQLPRQNYERIQIDLTSDWGNDSVYRFQAGRVSVQGIQRVCEVHQQLMFCSGHPRVGD